MFKTLLLLIDYLFSNKSFLFADEHIVIASQTVYNINAVVHHIYTRIIKVLVVPINVYYLTFPFVASKSTYHKVHTAQQINDSTRDRIDKVQNPR